MCRSWHMRSRVLAMMRASTTEVPGLMFGRSSYSGGDLPDGGDHVSEIVNVPPDSVTLYAGRGAVAGPPSTSPVVVENCEE